jgi:hypothetical protein
MTEQNLGMAQVSSLSQSMGSDQMTQQYCPPARSKACIKQTAPLPVSDCAIYLASGKRKSEGKLGSLNVLFMSSSGRE